MLQLGKAGQPNGQGICQLIEDCGFDSLLQYSRTWWLKVSTQNTHTQHYTHTTLLAHTVAMVTAEIIPNTMRSIQHTDTRIIYNGQTETITSLRLQWRCGQIPQYSTCVTQSICQYSQPQLSCNKSNHVYLIQQMFNHDNWSGPSITLTCDNYEEYNNAQCKALPICTMRTSLIHGIL